MPEPECQGCRELQGCVAQLEALVRELQARLGINATNSSLPPSANPPDAPRAVVKNPTGRQPGGQPGHPGHLRVRWPADQLKETIHFVPDVCAHCQAPLAAEPAADDPEAIWHQVAELPRQPVEVTEYQAHGRTCRDCGTVTWAKIPDDVRGHSYGPQLTALVSYLSATRSEDHTSELQPPFNPLSPLLL